MNMQPIYADCPYYSESTQKGDNSGVGEWLFDRGLCLPSGSSLTDEEIMTVINALREVLSGK